MCHQAHRLLIGTTPRGRQIGMYDPNLKYDEPPAALPEPRFKPTTKYKISHRW